MGGQHRGLLHGVVDAHVVHMASSAGRKGSRERRSPIQSLGEGWTTHAHTRNPAKPWNSCSLHRVIQTPLRTKAGFFQGMRAFSAHIAIQIWGALWFREHTTRVFFRKTTTSFKKKHWYSYVSKEIFRNKSYTSCAIEPPLHCFFGKFLGCFHERIIEPIDN